MPKLISFILVNYNHKSGVISAINSINKLAPQEQIEIIIVDNASTDGSFDFFSKFSEFPINYIYNNENLGFGSACNKGASVSSGEYIYFLNPDAKLETKIDIDLFFSIFSTHPDVGAISPLVIYPDGSRQISTRNFTTLTESLFRLLRLGRLYRRCPILRKLIGLLPVLPREASSYISSINNDEPVSRVDWIVGCSIIFTRFAFEKVGGFDEEYFLYSEDEDICWRLKNSGINCLSFPSMLVSHQSGGTYGGVENEFITKCKLNSESRLFSKKGVHPFIFKALAFGCGLILAPFSKRGRTIFSWSIGINK